MIWITETRDAYSYDCLVLFVLFHTLPCEASFVTFLVIIHVNTVSLIYLDSCMCYQLCLVLFLQLFVAC